MMIILRTPSTALPLPTSSPVRLQPQHEVVNFARLPGWFAHDGCSRVGDHLYAMDI